jgi:LytS/YehU family sensor histidine kinase
MVERMAALLRFTLDSHSGGLVGFDQEMKIVRDYLEIEQARLGGRLRWGIELKGDFDGLKIPPLSIQTLVENSIKFAVAPNRDGGEVRVFADRNNGSLRVNVVDTGEGFTLESVPAGHGLDNLRARLAVLYGDSAELGVRQSNGWTTVSMRVPV